MAVVGSISQIKMPSGSTYEIKDTTAREMIAGGITFIIAWNGEDTPDPSAIPEDVQVISGGTTYTGTLSADDAQSGAFYLIYSGTQTIEDSHDAYDEYAVVTQGSIKMWEKIGDTQLNLSNVVTDVSLSRQTDVVLGEATTFTNSSSSVTFSGGTNDKVLGEDTTFALTSGAVTHGTPAKDAVLGADTTFTGNATGGGITLNTTYLGATASGTAVGANGTAAAVTGYPSPTTDTFLKSASAETSKLVTTSITPTNGTETVSKVSRTASKLVTTSITPTNGTESVSKVTKTASKLVTTSIPNVTSAGSASTWSFAMGSGAEAETLIISGANGAAPTLGTAITAATGAVASTGTGSDIVTAVTISDKTVAKAGTAVTVATGSVATNGAGSDIVTAVSISDKSVAKVGSAITVATGEVDAEGTGSDIVTGVTVGTTASAITGLGTPSTATALTGVKVTAQPTITLAANTATATGRVQVATSVKSTTQPTITVTADGNDNVNTITAMPTSTVGTGITVGTNDKVTAITGIGTGTAAAQKITVGSNDEVTVLKNTTDVSVTKGRP